MLLLLIQLKFNYVFRKLNNNNMQSKTAQAPELGHENDQGKLKRYQSFQNFLDLDAFTSPE